MTTEQKIKFFKTECQRFIDFFGLYEWQVFFKAHDLNEYARAMCSASGYIDNHQGDGQQSTISYDEEWISDKQTEPMEISMCAFHEVLELMLMKLRYFAANNELIIQEREVDEEIHRVIRRLENKVYPLIK